MTVFFYDKTFKGLLTAIFDAYSTKIFPDKLLSEGDSLPLFIENQHTVITQEEKAERVWSGIKNKISKQACNMLLHVWLSEANEIDELLFRFIRKTFNSDISIETNFGDSDVLAVQKLAQKVSKEAHHLKEFIRFQKSADQIFFAPVSPAYNALPLVVEHFTDRFSDQQWVIYDLKRHYGFYYDLSQTTEISFDSDQHLLNGKLNDELMVEDEKMFQTLWKGYFESMIIKERINLKLQRQHMPKRFWKHITEKQ